MKKLLIPLFVLIIIILAAGIYLFVQQVYTQSATPTVTKPTIITIPSPSATPQPEFCKPSDLHATLTTEGAAGNIYGTLMIKNISKTPCPIQGKQFVEATFQAKNLTVEHVGTPSAEVLTLQPNQTVYSQLHYPNGPQCSGPTTQVSISYSYPIAPNAKVVFQDTTGKTIQTIPVCQTATEMTNLQVWGLSNEPVTQ
jgi:hypothetical protein